MKKAMLTTIMAIAVAGLLALFASPAMAEVIYFGSSPDEGLNLDSERMQALIGAVNAAALEDEGVVAPGEETYPDGGGSSGYTPSDDVEYPDAEYPDDGGGEGYVPPADVEYPDDGYDNPSNPDNPTTPEPPKTPPSSSKLPNTGTQMAIFAAIGLVVIAAAYGVRRAVARRSK